MNTKSILRITTVCFLLLSACSKSDDPEPSDDSQFKTTDFKVTVTDKKITSSGPSLSFVEVSYEVKNTTNIDYDATDFFVDWKVKATDGTEYMKERLVKLPLNKGQTAAESLHIDFTFGKTIDLNTLSYEVVYKP